MDILRFTGEYDWLSNFYPAEFVWDRIVWPSSEHAYQAAKTTDRNIRLSISHLSNAKEAKRIGKTIELRSDWNNVRIQVMKEIVREKFRQNPELMKKLVDTGVCHLEEGNNHHDCFWGVCPPGSENGMNHLGQVLMELREEFRSNV